VVLKAEIKTPEPVCEVYVSIRTLKSTLNITGSQCNDLPRSELQ